MKKEYQIWQSEFTRTALNPKENRKESRGNDKGSCNRGIVCAAKKTKTQKCSEN